MNTLEQRSVSMILNCSLRNITLLHYMSQDLFIFTSYCSFTGGTGGSLRCHFVVAIACLVRW